MANLENQWAQNVIDFGANQLHPNAQRLFKDEATRLALASWLEAYFRELQLTSSHQYHLKPDLRNTQGFGMQSVNITVRHRGDYIGSQLLADEWKNRRVVAIASGMIPPKAGWTPQLGRAQFDVPAKKVEDLYILSPNGLAMGSQPDSVRLIQAGTGEGRELHVYGPQAVCAYMEIAGREVGPKEIAAATQMYIEGVYGCAYRWY
ncbi:MAG: hypothetical protein AAB588_02105 [Patescibacteria group bacterium]